MARVPLSVLDLVPVSAGSDPATALQNTVDLSRHAEELGYDRYWIAEHHGNPGVAGTAPAIVIALIAGATKQIRIGSGGVQLGHRTALSVVEEFGLIDAAHPGRIDLGLGRSPGRGAPPPSASGGHDEARRAANGLLLPARYDPSQLLSSPRLRLVFELLQQPGARTPDYAQQIDDILALLGTGYRNADGIEVHAVPGEGAAVQIWILGAGAGSSAAVAGERGLRFAASYHHSPSTVLDGIEAYRAAFEPSPELDQPYVSVSADVVVGQDDTTASELATGYGLWVRSIRNGSGAIEFPTPEQARAHEWSEEDLDLVADRIDTQIVGAPETVVAGLEKLQEATGADELAITTMTHDHADRVRSYQLLAHEWFHRG